MDRDSSSNNYKTQIDGDHLLYTCQHRVNNIVDKRSKAKSDGKIKEDLQDHDP